jgi:Tol biopolymer transport system component
MNSRILSILTLLGLMLSLTACQGNTPQVSALLTPGATLSPTPTKVLTATPPPTVILTVRLTIENSATPLPTLTVTPLPAATVLNAFAVALSSDGKILAFNSSIDELVPEDQNHTLDAFVYQTESQTIQWIHPDKNEQLGKNLPSQAKSLSANGRFLLFGGSSNAPDPVTDHYNFTYLQDLETGQDERIDFLPLEKQFSLMSIQPILSPDGRYLALEVYSAGFNILLFDRTTGAVTPLGGLQDRQTFAWNSFDPTFSPDGRYLAFVSDLDSLVAGDSPCSEANPACGDIFLYEIATGIIERIPAHLQFTQGNPYPYLTVSAGARWLAWTEVVTSPSFFHPVIRLYNRTSGKTETICAGEEPACTGHSSSISADGRWIAFSTLAPTDASGFRVPGSYAQVYLFDHQTGQLTLVSTTAQGSPANGDSGIISLQSEGFTSDVHISGDGRIVAFSSQADNLLPQDTSKRQCYDPVIVGAYPCYDLFLYERENGIVKWISHPQ